MRIAPEVAQALADVGHIEPRLLFDDREVTVTWPNGTRLVVSATVGEERLELAYDLVVR